VLDGSSVGRCGGDAGLRRRLGEHRQRRRDQPRAVRPFLGEGRGTLSLQRWRFSAPLWWPPSCPLWRWPGASARVAGYRRSLEYTVRSRRIGSMASMRPALSAPPPLFGLCRTLFWLNIAAQVLKRLPAAAGDRLPCGVSRENAAGAAPSARALPLGVDWRLGYRHRRRPVWRRFGLM